MNRQELMEMVATYPRLYHLTARDSWDSIKKNGLLSTSMLLSRCKTPREQRNTICQKPRANSVPIENPEISLKATIRDQEPLYDSFLKIQLEKQRAKITPKQWHERQNRRVYFFLSKKRLEKFSKQYPNEDMLEINTRSLVAAHCCQIELCAYNSGYNKREENMLENPSYYKRHDDMFLPLKDYPYRFWQKHNKVPVNELTVLNGVLDIAFHAIKVVRMHKDEEPEVLEESCHTNQPKCCDSGDIYGCHCLL